VDIESLQNDFISAIFGGDKAPAISHVMGDDILTAEQRFGIYKGSVHGILTQALGTIFPVCKELVGDEFFDRMCDIFIDKYPPKTSFFAEYGSDLPLFLSTFEHVKDIPYLVDVAHLEWSRQTVWHAQDAQNTDFSSLANLDENQQSKLVFQLSNNMHLIQSDYRIDELWFAHQEDSELSLENLEINQAVKLIIRNEKKPSSSGIIKISVMSETQDDSEFWDFLFAISQEKNLAALAEQFGEALPTLLNQGIQSAWIQSYTIQ